MSIEFKSLRVILRNKSKTVIDHLIRTRFSRNFYNYRKEKKELCMFCGTTKNMTKEHVVPRWVYEGCTKKVFTTNINGLDQTYNKTTIPVCSACNNGRLNSLEVYINSLFSEVDPAHFSNSEMENIIRWLEIIDYKFQILNARRLFLASKEAGYIPYLADFPLSLLRPKVDYSPSKTITEIRRSQRRITIKNKSCNLDSLIVFKTSNKGLHFFHTMDEFIFIELPQYKLALFYFYKRTFPTNKKAQEEAKKIIDNVY